MSDSIFNINGKPPEFGNIEQIKFIKTQMAKYGAKQFCDLEPDEIIEIEQQTKIEFTSEKYAHIEWECPVCKHSNDAQVEFSNNETERCWWSGCKSNRVCIDVDSFGHVSMKTQKDILADEDEQDEDEIDCTSDDFTHIEWDCPVCEQHNDSEVEFGTESTEVCYDCPCKVFIKVDSYGDVEEITIVSTK